jgi:phosphoesterase RecJ-like protein
MARRLGAEITRDIACALYVALVTDTGRFSYENTGSSAHRMAAELIEAGVDVHETYRRLYERVPLEKLHLVARALERIERLQDGALAVTYISADDYAEAGAEEVLTEGIIDYVRSLEGTRLAAVIRDRADGGSAARKVSLRSTGDIDVSEIARRHGGGGHPRAAGFSTDLSYPELVEALRAELAARS